jgi:hypothetical protein
MSTRAAIDLIVLINAVLLHVGGVAKRLSAVSEITPAYTRQSIDEGCPVLKSIMFSSCCEDIKITRHQRYLHTANEQQLHRTDHSNTHRYPILGESLKVTPKTPFLLNLRSIDEKERRKVKAKAKKQSHFIAAGSIFAGKSCAVVRQSVWSCLSNLKPIHLLSHITPTWR